MKKIRKGFGYAVVMVMVLFLLCTAGADVYATGDVEDNGSESTEASDAAGGSEIKFKYAAADENKIKVYIRGADVSQGISYQIGSIPVSAVEIYKIEEDRSPMRTLIMLDNSVSIPSGSRGKITALLNGIVDAHAEKEEFRFATFSDKLNYLSDTYTNDYTALKNVIASISYSDQETYLTDVLYDLIDDLNKDAYMGYTRMIIISDGVDNKQLGVTREELNDKLKETPYPIYTVGTLTGKNNDQLESMFALSRISGSAYYVLEDTEISTIVSELSKDAQMAVVEAQIPEDAKVGGTQSSKLLFADSTQLVFAVHMPFHVKTVPETQVEGGHGEPPVSTAVEPVEEEKGVPVILVAGIAGGAVLLVAVIVIVVVLVKKKKRVPADGGEASRTEVVMDTETQRIDDEESGGVLPPSGQRRKNKYRVTFSDKTDMSRTYQCELKNSISLGKISGNDIVVNASTVSKRHCIITNRNGRIFIQDLNSTNGTFVNGERINFETEIFSGTTIRMGKEELIAKFEQV